MRAGSLFSGIGGFDLGLERVGFSILWQVERNKFCQQILKKHWPHVPLWDDIQTFNPCNFETVDCVFGGFPCQDLSSLNNNRKGIENGERSGLWKQFLRIIREAEPSYVIIENVCGLLERSKRFSRPQIEIVLEDLSKSGYDAFWLTIPAFLVGSTQARKRVFIYGFRRTYVLGRNHTYDDIIFCIHEATKEASMRLATAKKKSSNVKTTQLCSLPSEQVFRGAGWWATEPSVGRMVYGIPRRLHATREQRRYLKQIRQRNYALGNVVIPQVASLVGSILLKFDSLINQSSLPRTGNSDEQQQSI